MLAGAESVKPAPADLREYASTKLHAEQYMVNAVKTNGPRDSWSLARKIKITTKQPPQKSCKYFNVFLIFH